MDPGTVLGYKMGNSNSGCHKKFGQNKELLILVKLMLAGVKFINSSQIKKFDQNYVIPICTQWFGYVFILDING